MIRHLKPVLILAGAAAALGVILWALIAFVLPKETAGEEKGNAVALITADLSEAEWVEVENTFDHYKLLRKAIGTYYIEGKDDYPVDAESVNSLLEKLSAFTASKKLIERPSAEQLKGYGLESPLGTVRIKNRDDVISFSLGTTSASGNYYCRLAGSDTVYLVPVSVPDLVLASRYQFYKDQITDFNQETSKKETLTPIIIGGKKRAQTVKLQINELSEEETGAAYMIVEPIYQSFSSAMGENLYELLTALSSCPITDDDTGAETLAEYGLDQPDYTLTFSLEGKTETVYFGNVSGDAGYRYCKTENGKFIHLIGVSFTDMLGAPLKNYCDDMIYTRSADTLSEIVISGGERTFTIVIDPERDEAGNFNVTVNGRKADSDLFSDFYIHILTLGITDIGARGEAEEPRVSCRFTLKDGTVETLRFLPVSELKCFVELNGSGQFWVKTMNVDRILENAQKLYDGKVIESEW